jgi:hypothetical protein
LSEQTLLKQLNNLLIAIIAKEKTKGPIWRSDSLTRENMVEAEGITAVGRNERIINIGDKVKYVGSDTVGRVTDLKKDEKGKVWALLESTNLWYREETLEPTEIKAKQNEEEEKLSAEELEEKFRKLRETMQAFDLGKAGGGGAGG